MTAASVEGQRQPTIIVELELTPELRRFNAADPHCERCGGIGTFEGRACWCLRRSAA